MTSGEVWLKQLPVWWRRLATGLAERYPASLREECGLVARQTIESLLLLRLCEDRGLTAPDSKAFSAHPAIDLPDHLLEPILRQLSGLAPMAFAPGPEILGRRTSGCWICGCPAATARRNGRRASTTRPTTSAGTSSTMLWPTPRTLQVRCLIPPVGPVRSCWPLAAGCGRERLRRRR